MVNAARLATCPIFVTRGRFSLPDPVSSAVTPSTAASATRGSAPCLTSAFDHLVWPGGLPGPILGGLPRSPHRRVSYLAANGSASQPRASHSASASLSRRSPMSRCRDNSSPTRMSMRSPFGYD